MIVVATETVLAIDVSTVASESPVVQMSGRQGNGSSVAGSVVAVGETFATIVAQERPPVCCDAVLVVSDSAVNGGSTKSLLLYPF